MKRNLTLNTVRTVLVVILAVTALALNSGCAGTAKADNPTPTPQINQTLLGLWNGKAMTLQTDPNNLQSVLDFSTAINVSNLPTFGAFAPGMRIEFRNDKGAFSVITSDGKNDGQDYFFGVVADTKNANTFQLTTNSNVIATVNVKAISDVSAVLYITFASSISVTVNNAGVSTYDATATLNK